MRSLGKRGRARPVALVATAGLALVGLTACSPNAGSAALDELDAVASSFDETVYVDGVARNNLPFLGTADATVVLDEDTPIARAREIASSLSGFLGDGARTASWEYLDLQVGRSRFAIAPTADDMDRTLDLVETALESPGAEGVFVGAASSFLARDSEDDMSTTDAERQTGAWVVPSTENLALVVAEGAPLDAAYRTARTLASSTEPYASNATSAFTADRSSGVSDARLPDDGGTPETVREAAPIAELGLLALVAEDDTITGAHVSPGALTVRLDDARRIEPVRLGFSIGAAASDIEFTVNGGVVTDLGGASEAARAAGIAVAGEPGVTSVLLMERLYIDLDPTTVIEVLPRIVSVIQAEPAASELDSVTVASPDMVSIFGHVDGLDEAAAIATTLRSVPVVSRVSVGADDDGIVGSVEVDLTSTAVDDLTTVFREVRATVPDGTEISLRGWDDLPGAQYTQRFTTAPVVDIPRDEREHATAEAAEFAERVEEAWAAAG